MEQMGRPGFSAKQRAELWARWQAGESLSDIGRALGKQAGSIHGVVAACGGMAPAERLRSHLALTPSEREEISRSLAGGATIRQIAATLQRAPSTISREIARHGTRRTYRATVADSRAWDRARRPKPCRLATHVALQEIVAEKLGLDWSPEQIAGWLRVQYPGASNMHISHETIYRSLFIQARGGLKKERLKHLRSRRLMRPSRLASTEEQSRGQTIDAISIRERPAEVEDFAIPGHWEGDLISGAKNSHIATLVERHSRYTMLVKVQGKDAASVASALSREVRRLPREMWRSLTWDRGSEMASHKAFTADTDVKVYFCDPQSPWQRGTNEDTNRLLRQYFPKSTELAGFSQTDLDEVALRLNRRPRKTLGFISPADKLMATVVSTG